MQPATTIDTAFGNPEVQPVYVEAERRQFDLILSKSYTNQTASFIETQLDLSGYRYVRIVINITAITGTSPTLQLDLTELLPDGYHFDYFNAGTKTGGAFTYNVGPGCSTNIVLPDNMILSYVIAGTTPSVSFDVYVWGQA